MRPVRVAVPAEGNSVPVPLDIYQVAPVTVALANVTGTVTPTLQLTMDDIWDPDVTPDWVDAPVNISNTGAPVALVDAALGTPIMPTAIRVVNAGTGTAVLVVIQRGVMG